MTVSTTTSQQTFACNGVTRAFTCGFRVLDATEIRAFLITISTGTSLELVNGADFLVTGVGGANAIVTTAVAYGSDYQLKCTRSTAILQLTDYRDNDPFPAESHESALDRLTHIAQELQATAQRALRFPEPESGVVLPAAADRAGYLLGFDTLGQPIMAGPASGSASSLALDLANSASASKGAGQIGSLWSLNYAARTVGNDLRYRSRPSIFMVLSAAQQADVLARTFTLDLTATIAAALALCREWHFPSGGYRLSSTLTLAQDRQSLSGDGYGTEFRYTGAGVAIDFDGRPACSLESLLLSAASGAIGIRIGPNAGLSRFPHWWRLSRVMVIGNTPNWATTSLAAARAGFSAAGVQVVTAFYGTAEHCETSYCVGNGWHLLNQANGNTLASCHSRDSAVGVCIEGTGGGNSNGNTWLGGNIEASIAGSVGIKIGEADRNRFAGRMEVSAPGGTHVVVSPPVGTLAQENQFDLELTGSSAGFVLGDGVGSSQVRGTRICGGKFGASITIGADCLNTIIEGSPTGFSGVTITDNGYGTILHADVSNGTWYERPSAANTVATQHELVVGVGSVRESMNDNARTMSFTGAADLFQFRKVVAGADTLPVMMFGSYRLWVSPVNGKLYIKSADPTAHNDGTVIGTQT